MIDHRENAIVFKAIPNALECNFIINISRDSSVLVNPVIKIKDWNTNSVKHIAVNNQELSANDYKTALLDHKDCLIWLDRTFKEASKIQIIK